MKAKEDGSGELKVMSRDQAEAAMAVYTSLVVQLEERQAQQNRAKIEASGFDGPIMELRKRLERYAAALQEWATKNRAAEFADGKELELRQGWLRFKLGGKAVALLEGWTEELVLGRLRKLKRWRPFVRLKEEINKRRILDEGAHIGAVELAEVGMVIEQTERFYVEPRLQAPPK